MIRRLLAYPLLFLLLSSFARGPDITRALVTDQGQATPILEELLQSEGIEERDLAGIVAKTQKEWLSVWRGRGGLERRDLVDVSVEAAKGEAARALADEVGLLRAFNPQDKNFRYALCLGAFTGTAKRRLEGLIDLWKEGVRFENLVFLGGERLLRIAPGDGDDPVLLGAPIPKGMPFRTESDMLKALWELVQGRLPVEMQAALEGHVVFVDAQQEGALRPSTQSTLRAWLERFHPDPGTCLVMSSRGFVHYQYLVAKNVLGESFPIQAVSPAGEPTRGSTVKETLDTLAKCLFEINRSFSKDTDVTSPH